MSEREILQDIGYTQDADDREPKVTAIRPLGRRRNPSPNDGKPYYCKVCGLGFAEFLACEDVECELEDDFIAQDRIPPVCKDER